MVFHTLHSLLLGVSVQTFMCLCTCWAVRSAVHSFCCWCDSHPLLTLTIKSEVLKPWTVRNLLVLISTMAISRRWNYFIPQGAHNKQTNLYKAKSKDFYNLLNVKIHTEDQTGRGPKRWSGKLSLEKDAWTRIFKSLKNVCKETKLK